MTTRRFTLADRLLGEVDAALRTVAAKPRANRITPSESPDTALAPAEQRLSAGLMRVNHTGEIAAQALYRGQALVARDADLRSELLEAADEEYDHLAWCQERTEELGSRVSLLAPLWYAGSFTIGMAAGLSGDKTSLGFLAETEKQVTEHLEGHLDRLPENDAESRAIVNQMREDEIKHGQNALDRGGTDLPKPVKQAMRMASRVMTRISFRL